MAVGEVAEEAEEAEEAVTKRFASGISKEFLKDRWRRYAESACSAGIPA